jgi:hypothetical protein
VISSSVQWILSERFCRTEYDVLAHSRITRFPTRKSIHKAQHQPGSPWNTEFRERNGFHTGRNVRGKGRLHSRWEGYAHWLLLDKAEKVYGDRVIFVDSN